ncbi:MAG: hypothetical protein LBP98_08215 [Tannerella sp.]|jgi:hypothetical protein|nr:hypothetical protein [Tannerella sp.]
MAKIPAPEVFPDNASGDFLPQSPDFLPKRLKHLPPSFDFLPRMAKIPAPEVLPDNTSGDFLPQSPDFLPKRLKHLPPSLEFLPKREDAGAFTDNDRALSDKMAASGLPDRSGWGYICYLMADSTGDFPQWLHCSGRCDITSSGLSTIDK